MLQSHEPRRDVFGLACWEGRAEVMSHAHRHDDIEINFSGDSELVYLFRGRRTVVRPGGTAFFWAALPHQLVTANPDSTMRWLTVPRAVFLRWRMPDPLLRALLRGTVLTDGPADDPEAEQALFDRWSQDLSRQNEELRRIVLLEVEARLRRLALATVREDRGTHTSPQDVAAHHAAELAHFMATHSREPLTVERVAGAVPLHPHYAMRVFKDVIGTTLHAYLTECRLADARRLLMTTELPVAEVATTAGFGSQSHFYSRFTAAHGMPPATYRRLHRR
ncbi:helix-turn-helix domain-containing protein [Streptomyces sp. NPDC057382]|uniref:helix-turn-helix domain-containing protein n=1 Tax=unclassified Streptomyces TaxID=2593676 RepID=UPI0036269332